MRPQLQTTSGKGHWRREKPKDDEPRIKVVDGKTYEYCEKCNKGNGLWTTGTSQYNTQQHDPTKYKKKDSGTENNGHLGVSDNNTNNGNTTGNLASKIPISTLDFGMYNAETDIPISTLDFGLFHA